LAKKTESIAVRITPYQRQIIEKHAEKENMNLTSFLRKAIFSYINQVENKVNLLSSEEIEPKLKNILNLSKIIHGDAELLNKKLNGGS
jgi:hypothetical protein